MHRYAVAIVTTKPSKDGLNIQIWQDIISANSRHEALGIGMCIVAERFKDRQISSHIITFIDSNCRQPAMKIEDTDKGKYKITFGSEVYDLALTKRDKEEDIKC